MKQNTRAILAWLRRGLADNKAWWIVLGLLIVQALWFVFSAQYPMAFDENYHFGLIQLHAQQWLPYFTSQPLHSGAYGAIVRDPSYLYHWLMSYPYRLTTVFTKDVTAQIIVLRLLNVALFAYALTLYRRLLGRLGVSRALSTSIFAVFILIPVTPFLAAHINYDNLFMVAVPISALLTLQLTEQFNHRQINALTLLTLFIVLCLASLIKYPFLPVLLVITIYVLWRLGRNRLISSIGLRTFWESFKALGWLRQVLLVGACLVSFGLFAERYLGNVVKYHNPVPACDAVISEDECLQYGPYGRDYVDKQQKSPYFHANPLIYAWQWMYGMWYRLFFAINYDYATQPPLLAIGILSILLAVLLALGIILRFRALFFNHGARQFVLWLTVGYTLVLFADGFSSYASTGQPVAVNGRYLIPFLPFLAAFGGLAWTQLLQSRTYLKTAVASGVIAVFLLQGGGAMTFINRSADSWMWPNAAVRSVNRTVRSITWPLILGKNVH